MASCIGQLLALSCAAMLCWGERDHVVSFHRLDVNHFALFTLPCHTLCCCCVAFAKIRAEGRLCFPG
jgi:hypothetical protein